jgi:mono/diheme cytochrome c family protein
MRAAFLLAPVSGALLILACAPATPPTRSGAELYAEFCASCHGADGTGDGPAAADLDPRPADLTRISARNGGTFPLADVMSTIDGYRRAQEGNVVMPEFGVMLEDAPLVMVDTGDGIETPTPAPLYAVAEYLRTIQR